ncbi:MAG TPA: Hsp70 family protein [Polyangiaceae bacterium]|nr:Hsp70 family protein [Polyangiaceae bacterium]
MHSTPTVYAIDFGTTNSLVCAANAERTWAPLSIDPGASDPSIFRSLLFFPDDNPSIACGQAALSACADSGMRGRLIRSLKRFLPAQTFTETRIGTRRYALEELVAILLRTLRERADAALSTQVRAVVLGRPVRFSDDPECDALAAARLERAARLAGFDHVELCEEPVAAALDCAEQQNSSELCAVLDLGGGTSDFTIARLGAGRSDVLAIGGIAIAGDALDGSLMRERVSPYFGSTVRYRMPFGGNVLTFPKPLLEKMCSPAELSLLDRREVLEFLRSIRVFSLSEEDRERMDRLLCLVEDRLGFQIFEVIDQTKRALSASLSAPLHFDYPGIELDEVVTRSEFEAAASRPIQSILERLEQTLERAGVGFEQLDRVYFTGGTARVPAIVQAVSARVHPDRIQHVRTFHAVVQGLAERARQIATELAH